MSHTEQCICKNRIPISVRISLDYLGETLPYNEVSFSFYILNSDLHSSARGRPISSTSAGMDGAALCLSRSNMWKLQERAHKATRCRLGQAKLQPNHSPLAVMLRARGARPAILLCKVKLQSDLRKAKPGGIGTGQQLQP